MLVIATPHPLHCFFLIHPRRSLEQAIIGQIGTHDVPIDSLFGVRQFQFVRHQQELIVLFTQMFVLEHLVQVFVHSAELFVGVRMPNGEADDLQEFTGNKRKHENY